MKRILSLVCALALALTMVPLTVSASGPASKEDIEKAVSSQIRSFADSLKQSDAVDNAAKALARHGLTQKGKKLTAGKSHALTAALWSTEMLRDAMIRGCSELLWLMQLTDPTKTAYICSSPAWYDGSGANYSASRCSSPGYEAEYCLWRQCEGDVPFFGKQILHLPPGKPGECFGSHPPASVPGRLGCKAGELSGWLSFGSLTEVPGRGKIPVTI